MQMPRYPTAVGPLWSSVIIKRKPSLGNTFYFVSLILSSLLEANMFSDHVSGSQMVEEFIAICNFVVKMVFGDYIWFLAK